VPLLWLTSPPSSPQAESAAASNEHTHQETNDERWIGKVMAAE
jgi:hypothetical protein